MGGSQGQRPAGGGAAARDLDDDLQEGRQPELVSAVPAGLQDAVEAGAQEVVVGVLRVVRQPLGPGLAIEERGPQGDRPLDDLALGQLGLWGGDHGLLQGAGVDSHANTAD
jgi:hypothetical protein